MRPSVAVKTDARETMSSTLRADPNLAALACTVSGLSPLISLASAVLSHFSSSIFEMGRSSIDRGSQLISITFHNFDILKGYIVVFHDPFVIVLISFSGAMCGSVAFS